MTDPAAGLFNAAVATASREIGRDFIDPTSAAVVAGTRPRTVADLGCGGVEGGP